MDTDVKHIVNLSGGKDSTFMLLEMLDRGMQVDAIHYADVGPMAEFDEMYEYIDRVEERIGRPITRLRSEKHTAESIFYGYPTRGKHMDEIRGVPPTIGAGCRYRSWLKSDVLDAAAGKDNIVYIGFAADELRRVNQNEYTKSNNRFRFPLVDWEITEAGCLQGLKDRNLYNPLYDYFRRLGCFWCPKQPLGSLRNLYHHFPNHWATMKKMEEDQGRPLKYGYTISGLEERFASGR